VYKDYKVVAVTPAGRKDYLEILSNYIARDSHIIDEWHLWLNTVNHEDISFCERLKMAYPFVRTKPLPGRWSGNQSIHRFFVDCVDPNTIYIRFDDDIVWVDEDAIVTLLDFRIANPDYFLIFPNIVNNSLMSHIHQRMGILPTNMGICDYAVLDKNGWRRGDVAEMIHREFLKNLNERKLDRYKFERWILYFYERFSINSFAFFGKDFAQFSGKVDLDEENWLSKNKPSQLGRMNCVCGDSLLVHFAYHTQRPFLEDTDILKKYANLCGVEHIKRSGSSAIVVSNIKNISLKEENWPTITIAVVPDKMEYNLNYKDSTKVVSIAPHKQEHTVNLDLFKVNLWCKKHNYLLRSYGNVNQFPLLSMVSDSVILAGGTPDIYGNPPKHKLPPLQNYQEVDVTGQTHLTDWMRLVKSEITNEEVVKAFTNTKIYIRKSTFDLYQSLKDELPKNCIWCETKFDRDHKFNTMEAINQIRQHNFGIPVYGLEENFAFQKSILNDVRHHYMGIQVLCSLLSDCYFLCLRGSSNLFSLLPARCICYSEAYLEHTITAYTDHRHVECVKQFPPNKELLKEILIARYGDIAGLAWVEPWERPNVTEMLKYSHALITAMSKIKIEVVYET
jgi:hypothetical protein